MSFLADVSKGIFDSGFPLQETVIVLPNERARRMLLHHLTQHLKLPAFLPAIYSIEHFVDLLSPLQTLDKLELLTALFETARQMEPPLAASFDEMLTWAPAYLSDIDEIDMQMQDGEYVFRTLAFDKEFTIAMANPDQQESLKEKMGFYARLAELYTLFRDQLRQEKQAYNGLKFRNCAEHIEQYAQKLNFKHFVFAGFHVFTPAELSVVSYIKNHFDTRFFFDIDPFYCDFNQDDRFTTAFFLKKICSGLDMPVESVQFVNHHYEDIEKKIQIVGVAKEMNQIYYAIDELNHIEREQGDLNGTAVVLADEHLLVPFLSAYGMKDVNITMGYPITATPAFSLLNSLLDLYQTALRYSHGGEMRFHHRDVVSVMHNSLIQKCLCKKEPAFGNELKEIEDAQRSLYRYEDLPVSLLPAFTPDISTLLPALIQYYDNMMGSLPSEGQDFAVMTMLRNAMDKVSGMLDRITQSGHELLFSTVRFFIAQSVDNLSIPIQGDSMNGLQVMGLLETRTLDFKNIIMLSVNEGTLPAGISNNTLLPFEIKYDNNSLPSYLYKDQIYAYHFFRLLQRAENVVLLYNNDLSSSIMEKSRFINQLEFTRKEKGLVNLKVSYPQIGFQFKASVPETIEVEKSPELLGKLYDMRYSATMLNKYINCPLQFYLKYVCKIEPRQTFQERIESNIIGTVVHALLEDVFNSIKQNPSKRYDIVQEYIDHLKERINDKLYLDETLKLHLTPYDLTHGRIFLASRMVYNDVLNYLHKAIRELESDNVEIVGNELHLENTISLDGRLIKLQGKIDRLQINHPDSNTVYPVVVDYKTGKVSDEGLMLEPEKLGALVMDTDYAQMVQLLFYAMLLKNTSREELAPLGACTDMKCGIINIKDTNRGLNYPEYWHPVRLGNSKGATDCISKEVLSEFETLIGNLLLEIMNPEIPFVQASDEKRCGYCDFRHICQRVKITKR